MRNGRRVSRAFALLLLLIVLFDMFAVGAVWPSASGTDTRKSGSLVVDISNASDGYVMVRGGSSKKRLKLRIARDKTTFTYDLNQKDEYEVFPLQMGSGNYTCTLYENAKGNKYSQAGQVSFTAKMNNELAPYLCPNQYVNYTKNTPAVSKAAELCANAGSDKEKFEAISKYVEHNFKYDFVSAVSVKGSKMPDIDACFKKGMGICQDLSAMVVCMLRSQGVPARLMIGYADKQYHAWVTVFVNGDEIMYDPTAEVGTGKKAKEYTVERYY